MTADHPGSNPLLSVLIRLILSRRVSLRLSILIPSRIVHVLRKAPPPPTRIQPGFGSNRAMPAAAKKTRRTATKGTQPDWTKILQEAQQRFGIQRFRPGQKEVLTAVFAGRDCLALMPTGAGKSLTYQLPACFLPKPVVVVSPLIALMQDQQAKAERAEITSESLNSTLRHAEALLAEHQIAEHIAQLIYVTPERLQTEDFLQQLESSGGISLLVVDEAHTIVQWGHDFRPAFQAIGEARRRLGNPPVLALTATATEDVQAEIIHSLHMHDELRVNTGTDRTNLFFSVHPTVNSEAKFARILAMLEHEQGTGIIYTASVRSADELFEFLTEHSISVGHYHGKMTAKERREVQEQFMRGDHKVMIATKAFGLGIDKPDIRFVYHFEFPDSLETYYQEAGRAGRDGQNAHAVLLYRLEDKRIQSFFLAGRYPKATELQAVYEDIAGQVIIGGDASELPETEAEPATKKPGKRKTEVILNLLREAGLIRRTGSETGTSHELDPNSHATPEQLAALLQTLVDRATRDQQHLDQMMHYAETPHCRTGIIRTYFGDHQGDPCLRCDNCAHQHADRMPHPHLELLGRKPPQSAPIPEPTPTATRQEVHVVETLHGSYQTTHHREEVPAPPALFQPGDQVRHISFGPGKVVECEHDMVTVAFKNGASKRLRADFLKAA